MKGPLKGKVAKFVIDQDQWGFDDDPIWKIEVQTAGKRGKDLGLLMAPALGDDKLPPSAGWVPYNDGLETEEEIWHKKKAEQLKPKPHKIAFTHSKKKSTLTVSGCEDSEVDGEYEDRCIVLGRMRKMKFQRMGTWKGNAATFDVHLGVFESEWTIGVKEGTRSKRTILFEAPARKNAKLPPASGWIPYQGYQGDLGSDDEDSL